MPEYHLNPEPAPHDHTRRRRRRGTRRREPTPGSGLLQGWFGLLATRARLLPGGEHVVVHGPIGDRQTCPEGLAAASSLRQWDGLLPVRPGTEVRRLDREPPAARAL